MADVPLESSPQPPAPRGNQVLVSLLLFLLQLGAWPAVVVKDLQSVRRPRAHKQKTIRLCIFIGALILTLADASLRMVVPEPLALAMIALVYYWGAAEYYVLYHRKILTPKKEWHMFGKVEAVCSSPVGNIPKYPQPFATMATWGLEGDFHNREHRPSFSQRGTFKPNTDRHISLVASEVLDGLGKLLGKALGPGALGENITTRGLGDLSQIPDGALLTIGTDVVLRVSQQNAPCKNVRAAYGVDAYTWVKGRRGLLCSIEQGFRKTIWPYDVIAVTF